MANVNYSTFFDEVLPEVAGCIQAVALNAIRNAAIEFCEKSLAYLYNHPAINAVLNTPAYAFVPPSGTLVAKVLQVFYNGIEIFPKTPDELKSYYPTLDWRDRTGTPLFYTQDDERNIILVPMPDASLTGAIKMRVALKPTRASTTIVDRIWEEHLETIKNGALYRLKIQPNKPYSDEAGAKTNFAFFNDQIETAKSKASRGFGRANRRVVPHFF
ncbi:MAG: hypothetical protein A2V79_09215 [Betaproteobacteria bacterium RBG_16_56_24]|nr:MAG: hypothetical protein A2V79_09215 [Betaproteobacteria bacterium RBG_16_56_24]